MDAQSPGVNNVSGAVGTSLSLAEPSREDISEADDLKPVQRLTDYARGLEQQRRETDNVLHVMESVCRENAEKSDHIA